MAARDFDSLSVQELVHVYDTLATEKSTLSNLFQEVTDYVLPTKSNVTRTQVTPGERRGSQRYDDTAVHANELLAASLQGSVTSSAFQWFKLRLREEELDEIEEVREWLDDCGSRMYNAFNSSNFGTESHECYLDLGGYGTTALSVMEKPRTEDDRFTGLLFRNWPVSEYVFAENEEGIVTTIMRKFKLRAYEAAQWFPGQNLGKKVTDALNSEKTDKRFEQFEFVHAIYPRFDGRIGGASRRMPFASKYIALADKHLISESGYQELPVMVTRWLKSSDDRGWGRSPAMTAMPSVRSLNVGRKLMLKAWAKDVDPPLIAEDKGVVGQIRTYASGVTYVRKNARLDYLQSNAKWDVSQYNEEELRRQIRNVFFADQLVPPTDPQMTATEFLKRVETMQRLLGPVLGRISTEFLDPTVERVFNLMLRGGAFRPVPDALIEYGATIDIEYVGPLSRAQKMQDVEAIERTYAQAGAAVQMTGDTSIWDNFDHDEAVSITGHLNGVPAKVLRGADERDEVRKMRAQAAQEQAALQQAEQASTVAKNMRAAQP